MWVTTTAPTTPPARSRARRDGAWRTEPHGPCDASSGTCRRPTRSRNRHALGAGPPPRQPRCRLNRSPTPRRANLPASTRALGSVPSTDRPPCRAQPGATGLRLRQGGPPHRCRAYESEPRVDGIAVRRPGRVLDPSRPVPTSSSHSRGRTGPRGPVLGSRGTTHGRTYRRGPTSAVAVTVARAVAVAAAITGHGDKPPIDDRR
jgi:hypothetical protein